MTPLGDLYEKYMKLMKQFRQTCESLLLIRSSFNKNMAADILTTVTSVAESEEQEAENIEELVNVNETVKRIDKFNFKAEIKNPYYRIFFMIILWTFIGFGCIATGAALSSYSKFIGDLVIVSKGWAGAILMAWSFLMISVSYDLLSCIRRTFKHKWLSWMDHNIIIHRFWGYVICIYAVTHSICHLFGSMRRLSDTEDVEEIKEHLKHYEYHEKKEYHELLFGSLTGITGVLLLVIILLMSVTSLKCVRRRWYQLFGYTHMTLFPMFFIWIMIHGTGFWFNWGVPFAIIFIFPGFFMLMLQQVARFYAGYKYDFKVADVSLSSDCKFMLLYLIKPKNYKLKHGQFCFINVPTISWTQWHPFTVASTPSNPYLILMIKRSGDWTEKLINNFYQIK